MAPKCCVPGCLSNYASTIPQDGYIPVFRFPSAPELMKQWTRNIPRADWQPSSTSVVCIKHFNECYISRTERYKDASGEWKEFPRKKLVLVSGAVPTVFLGLPGYLTKSIPTQRTDPQERRQAAANNYNLKVDQWLETDKIVDFTLFCDKIRTGEKLCDPWGVHFQKDRVIFCIYNFENIPRISVSITVADDLVCSVVVNNQILTKEQLKWILPSNLKVTLWSQLQNLLARYKNFESVEASSNQIQHYIETVKSHLSSLLLLVQENGSSEHEKQLKFVCEQFNLIFSKQRKYPVDVLLWAFMIYLQSSSCYSAIRETGSLVLPHPKYLQQLASSFLISPKTVSENEHFLKASVKHLSDRERYVVLQIDEIYVNPRFDFKGGQIIGFAKNNITLPARTLQCFLVSSAFGSFKELVSLHPVKNADGSDLHALTSKIINFVHSCNLKIVVIVSDNNRVNRCLFNLMNPSGTYSVNLLPSHVTFLTFDSVHVFKNIRNNWLNLKDPHKTFIFPPFHGDGGVLEARFSDLRQLYQTERNCLLKRACKLSYKSIFPTNLERQKVSLVCAIFNEFTYSALKEEWDKKSGVCQNEGTCEFINIIYKWWSIVNIKSQFKGNNTRNKLEVPFESVNDERLHFLENFLLWLEKWKKVGKGCLTNDTFSALFQCTAVLINFIKHSLNVWDVNFVLPGKVQTDNLERKFSSYRQLCGGNYNISVAAVLDCEKKLRVKSLLGLKSCKYGTLRMCKLSDLDHSQDEKIQSHHIEVDDFHDILQGDYMQQEIDMSPLIYVAGYAAFSLSSRMKCSICISHLKAEETCQSITDSYVSQIDRGGLTVPSDLCMEIGKHVFCIMNILISEQYESQFLLHGNQKRLLLSLSKLSLTQNLEIRLFVSDDCVCGVNNGKTFDKVMSVFCNVVMNNYVKEKNGGREKSKQQKRKLHSLTQ